MVTVSTCPCMVTVVFAFKLSVKVPSVLVSTVAISTAPAGLRLMVLDWPRTVADIDVPPDDGDEGGEGGEGGVVPPAAVVKLCTEDQSLVPTLLEALTLQ